MGTNKDPMYPLRAPAEELEAWREAAEAADETLAEWLREAARLRLEGKGARASFASVLKLASKELERMQKRLHEATGGAAAYWDGWLTGRRTLIEQLSDNLTGRRLKK